VLGDPIAGASIGLVRSFNNATWSSVTTVTTDASGVASYFGYPMERNTYFKMTFAGTDMLAPAQSAVRTVLCRAFLSRPRVSRVGSRVYRFVGELKPRHTAGSNVVRLDLQRRQGGRWVTRSTVWASASNFETYSRYSATKRLPAAGSWRVRARHADGSHASTFTTWRYFTVR
jgi:hypothetical protein